MSLSGLLHPWGQDMMFMALSTRRCTHEDKCLLYAKALYQIPVSGFLYTLSEGVSRCRRLIQTGGYALAHLSPFFENISPNKFRSDIFSNCETSQSPCCGERGLSDQWRMWPLLFLETRGNPETHKVALPPHHTRDQRPPLGSEIQQQLYWNVMHGLDPYQGFFKCLPHSSSK